MFCKKCGAEIMDEAVICPKCGCETKNRNEKLPVLDADEPKTGIGILCGLFLGLIGLIIGLCLYKEGTIARNTFMKSFLTTWGITFAISVIILIIYLVNLNSLLNNAFYY